MSLPWSIARLYSRVAPSNRGTFGVAKWARGSVPKGQWDGRFDTPGGLRLDLDLATYPDVAMALDLYETDTLRLLRKLLRNGDHFVDCGANLGYFTLHASRLVGTGGRVDAFEPDPMNRERLEAHLKINAATNVRVHALAVTSDAKPIPFYHPAASGGAIDMNHGQASTFAALVPDGEMFTVQSARLDEMLDRVPKVIKLDVEGAELSALQGAEKLLRGDAPPALVIEHNHESATAAGYRPSEVFRFLTSVQPRYRVFWIGWRLREIETAEALDAIARQGNILVRANANE